jgi:hypothetical protein
MAFLGEIDTFFFVLEGRRGGLAVVMMLLP